VEMKHCLFRCAALRTDEVHPLRGDCHLHGPADTDDGSHELGGERFIQFPDVGYVTTRDQERVTNGRPAPVRGVQVHGMVYGMVTDCRERRIGPTDYRRDRAWPLPNPAASCDCALGTTVTPDESPATKRCLQRRCLPSAAR